MTEILISQYEKMNTAWYQTRPVIKTEYIEIETIKSKSTIAKEKRSLWSKINEKFFKKLKKGDKIIPVFSIKEVKSLVYSKLGATNGATFRRFVLY